MQTLCYNDYVRQSNGEDCERSYSLCGLQGKVGDMKRYG